MSMRCSDVLQCMALHCRFKWKCNIAACVTWFDGTRVTAGDPCFHFISFHSPLLAIIFVVFDETTTCIYVCLNVRFFDLPKRRWFE